MLVAAASPRTGEVAASAEATDEDLARRFVAGDAGAFDQLVHRHRDTIYRFVRWHLATAREEAEDVTQDVLLEMLRSLPRYEGRSRLRTWVLGLAHNLCRRRRRARQSGPAAGPGRRPGEEELGAVAERAIDAEALLARRELQERVRSAIGALVPEHRDVVLLRELEGLSYQEIAAVLDVPIGTVRSRLHNARVALAECLVALDSRKGTTP
jgi:RNA polymerase sigma-70 factor (ECF subfamily)